MQELNTLYLGIGNVLRIRISTIGVVDSAVLYLLGGTFAISLISLFGVLLLFLKDDLQDSLFVPLVAFSAGTLLATAFIHLIPEATNQDQNSLYIYIWVLGGFMSFFIAEQFFNWQVNRHRFAHDLHSDEDIHDIDDIDDIDDINDTDDSKSPASYLILFADGIHNFVGGLAIGSSFLISIEVGIITTIASAAHEIPQEFGDFGILVHGGWEKQKAFLANFISALSIIPGGLIAYYLGSFYSIPVLLGFAAGNFIYIAASDLVPEINHGQSHHIDKDKREVRSIGKSFFYLTMFIVGNVFIIFTRLLLHS